MPGRLGGLDRRGGDYEQIHLRLRKSDAAFLRQLAAQREQTLSAAVAYLLRGIRNKSAPGDRDVLPSDRDQE